MLERFKVPEKNRVYIEVDSMRHVTEAIFQKQGLSTEEAKISTDVLIINDLRGVESHGVSNGLRRYVSEYSSKNLNPRPNFREVYL